MANHNVEQAVSSLPAADAINSAGGLAYALEARHALAQIAATGTLRQGDAGSAEGLIDEIKRLAVEVDDLYLAKLAIYAREQGAMKDMPAVLVVLLAARGSSLFQATFDRVVDNGRMLRTTFQLVRSGALEPVVNYAVLIAATIFVAC